MANTGFFKVYRKLFDHEIGKDPLAVALWVKLVSMASYEDKDVLWDGKAFSIKRGQLITSIKGLAKWLGVSQGRAKRYLNGYQNVRQIEIKTTNKYTIVTIRNYDKYQANGEQNENRMRTNREQTETTKEYKEIKEYKKKEFYKKENEIISDPDFQRLLSLKGSLGDAEVRMKSGIEVALEHRYPAWKYQSQWREALDYKKGQMN